MLRHAALPLILAMCAGAAGCRDRQRPAAPAARPNILLVTVDTFRADRLEPTVAPVLDQLAAGGLRFTAARSAVPLTLPSHATIHTGLLPPQHGVRENGTGALADSHLTIARALKDGGYRTAAFVGAFVLDRRFGLARGFDTYDDQIARDPNATERLEAERPASVVIDRALAWLSRQGAAIAANSSPWFVWIHLYDPHAPYTPPPDIAARAKSPYDGEVAYADAQIGRVFDTLRARGDFDRTLIVVAGDHGEGLGEHGERTHGMLLYESTLRVPLVVVAPHVAARRIDVPVSLVDVAPTILRAAGVTPAPEMKGRNLIADVAGDSRTDLYSETEYPHVAGWSPLQALTDGRWKAIRAGAATEVYDLQHDPGEQHDVATAQPAVATAIASRAAEIHGAATDRGTTLSADAGERLRALGYVASTAQTPPASSAPNPRTTIAAWNEFEDALAALNHHKVSAVDALKSLAAAHPDALVFQTTYARSLKDAGRPIAALKVYRDAARRWPGDADLVHDLAVAAREAASTAAGPLADSLREEAARADEAALAIDPHSATAANGLGLLAVDAGRPEAAAQAFAKATTLDPNNASYWTNLGNARRALHDTAAARQAYDRALAVDPAYADAANGIGVMLVEGKRPADAVPWFERAIAASPDLVEARLNLGIALQQSGDPRRAAVEYKQVLAAPPRFARERDAAGKLLASLGTVK